MLEHSSSKILLVVSCLLLLFSCSQNEKTVGQEEKILSKISGNKLEAGTLISADSMRIPDPLNEQYFTVRLLTTDASDEGTYELQVVYGMNDASTELTFPQGTEPVTPTIKKGKEPFSYVIGFLYGADTTFNDYFLVQSIRNQTKMRYLKAYTLP